MYVNIFSWIFLDHKEVIVHPLERVSRYGTYLYREESYVKLSRFPSLSSPPPSPSRIYARAPPSLIVHTFPHQFHESVLIHCQG